MRFARPNLTTPPISPSQTKPSVLGPGPATPPVSPALPIRYFS
jgi:hypothetical protein